MKAAERIGEQSTLMAGDESTELTLFVRTSDEEIRKWDKGKIYNALIRETSISDDAAWLSCAPAAGDSTGEHDTVTVTYDTSGLAAGSHSATITIAAAGAGNTPQTITVSLTVAAPAKKSGGGGGGGGCSLAAGSEPLGWALPYLALAGAWLFSRRRRRRRE